MSKKTGKLIIKGVTRDGRKFRPSDWAQRLSTAVARTDRKRVRFHPKVTMMTTLDGVNCVVIDKSLEEEDPLLFEFLVNFARFNNLEVTDE